MKRKFYLIFTLLIIGLACKKNKDDIQYHGTASATFNGKAWQSGKVRCVISTQCYKGKLSIHFHVYNSQGFLRESLGIANIPVAKATYTLNPADLANSRNCNRSDATASYHTLQDHGDVLLDSYDALPSADNYLAIEEYNERTKKLSGRFSVIFKIHRRQDPNSPDTIKVTNGRFDTKILE